MFSMRVKMNLFTIAGFVFFATWFSVAVTAAPNRPMAVPDSEPASICQSISLSPVNRSFTADGGNAFINVDHEPGCTFTAMSNARWIRITSVIVTNYGGTVYYSVMPALVSSAQTDEQRSGVILVGSQSFPIYQNLEPMQSAPSIVWTGLSHNASANAVAFSPDGQLLASASSDHTVKIWRVADGALLRTLTGFFDSVSSVAFSHNGHLLAAGSTDRNVKVWNVDNWSLIRTTGLTDFVFGVSFAPNDANLAVAGGYSGNWIHILRTSDWEEIALLGYGQEENRSIAYSNDGQFLAWAMLYPGVRLQNVGTGSYCILEGADYYGTNAVAFSPDSHRLATGSDSQEVGVWDVASCGELLSLNGPSGFVKSVVYAPSGQMILSGGQDFGASRGTLLFWRANNGALVRAYAGQTSTAVLSVQYSPQGNFFAYGRADGAVVLARNPF
jgi:WD40 repeat protein